MRSHILSLLALVLCVRAQEFSISPIRLDDVIEAGIQSFAVFKWDFVGNLAGAESRTSIELIAGSNTTDNNNVVDIIDFNRTSPVPGSSQNAAISAQSFLWTVPSLLRGATYHIRINSTFVPFTVDRVRTDRGTVEQRVYGDTLGSATARSFDFKTRPIIHQCWEGAAVDTNPPAFSAINSPSSSNFTSFRLLYPARFVDIKEDKDYNMSFKWAWRNAGNHPVNLAKFESGGVSSLIFQIQTFPNLTNVGEPFVPSGWNIEDFPEHSDNSRVDLKGLGAKVNGSYILTAKYTNVFQDGAVAPGQVVTANSEPWSLVAPKGDTCPEGTFDADDNTNTDPFGGGPGPGNAGMSVDVLHPLRACAVVVLVAVLSTLA